MQRRLLKELISNSEVSPETLLDSLTLLPITLRAEYHKFVFDNLDTLESAESIRKIFHHIALHFTFIDYGLMSHLIEEHGSDELQQDMSAYSEKLQSFLSETTVLHLINHWPVLRDKPPHFEDLLAVIDGDPRKCNLQELDRLRKKFCSKMKLSDAILIMIGVGRKNSFVVHWMLPSMYVSRLKSLINDAIAFFEKELILSVTLGRQRLYAIAVREGR